MPSSNTYRRDVRDVELPLPGDLPAPPRYGEASLADLLPAVLAALGVPGPTDVLGLSPLSRVIVLVVDGLGRRNLRDHPDVAPFLTAEPTRTLDAVFPSTTATSIASIGTGRTPGGHGLVGYATALPGETDPFNLLTWRVGPEGGGRDVRGTVAPERFQPVATAFERAAAAGVATTVVLAPPFAASGLTRAALRGGSRVIAEGLEATLEAALAAVRRPAPALVYAYHPDVDGLGHLCGPDSDEWREALGALDAALADLRPRLPRDTTLLVTADHGMVGVPDDELVDVAGDPGLAAGVRVVAGEPRMRQLFTREGRTADVARRWRSRLGDRALVLRRGDAVDAGLFGPVADRVRPRIGDVLVLARRGTVVHGDIDPMGGRLAGHHGSLDPRELEVPLIRLGD